MSAGEREPACVEAIEHGHKSSWKLPDQEDINTLRPCGYCFPDGEADLKHSLLTVSESDPACIHRIDATGPIDYDAVHPDNPDELRDLLLSMDPEDAGLSPMGGDA